MSISTLVLIVLAIIVLVLVVIGFTGGWQNLWDRISNLGGSDANVQLVVQACGIACNSNAQYDYCTQQRDVTFDTANKQYTGKYTCDQLAKGLTVEVEGDGPPAPALSVGLESCQSITCPTP